VLNIGSDVMFKSHKKGAKGPNNNTHKIVLLVVNIHSVENYPALGLSAFCVLQLAQKRSCDLISSTSRKLHHVIL
jgi:hypothetical protein